MDSQSPREPGCDDCAPLIDALADGAAVDPARRRDLDRHLAECGRCRAIAADLQAIHRVARELPVHSPRPEVWARIAIRFETEMPSRRLRVWTGAQIAMAVAAVLVLAVASTVMLLRGPLAGPSPQPSTPTAPTASQPGTVHALPEDLVKDVDEHLRIADEHYVKAIAGLEQVVDSGQAALDPAVAGTLQKNLGIIDQAIHESREALKTQPNSRLAQTSLFEALRQKVALLEDTIALINVMRKGDQAGAAKIIGGLSKS